VLRPPRAQREQPHEREQHQHRSELTPRSLRRRGTTGDGRLRFRSIVRGATTILSDSLKYDLRGKVVRNYLNGDSLAYTALGQLRYGRYANATGVESYTYDAVGNAAAADIAATGAAPTARVLGHYPEYLQVAEAIGAKAFNIPTKIWNAMSESAQWAANQKFLDRGVAQDAEFVMATARADIRAGSALVREVTYLLGHGYQWAANGMSLIPK
jgi:hypothetical protein